MTAIQGVYETLVGFWCKGAKHISPCPRFTLLEKLHLASCDKTQLSMIGQVNFLIQSQTTNYILTTQETRELTKSSFP